MATTWDVRPRAVPPPDRRKQPLPLGFSTMNRGQVVACNSECFRTIDAALEDNDRF